MFKLSIWCLGFKTALIFLLAHQACATASAQVAEQFSDSAHVIRDPNQRQPMVVQQDAAPRQRERFQNRTRLQPLTPAPAQPSTVTTQQRERLLPVADRRQMLTPVVAQQNAAPTQQSERRTHRQPLTPVVEQYLAPTQQQREDVQDRNQRQPLAPVVAQQNAAPMQQSERFSDRIHRQPLTPVVEQYLAPTQGCSRSQSKTAVQESSSTTRRTAAACADPRSHTTTVTHASGDATNRCPNAA